MGVPRSIETRNKTHACMALRRNETKKNTVLRIRMGRDQGRGRCLGMCRKQLPCFPEICYQALRLEPNREEGSMDAYAPEIERKMKRLFDSLSEDDRRR